MRFASAKFAREEAKGARSALPGASARRGLAASPCLRRPSQRCFPIRPVAACCSALPQIALFSFLPPAPSLAPPAVERVCAARFLGGFWRMNGRFCANIPPIVSICPGPALRGRPGHGRPLRPELVWTVWIWTSSRFSTPSTPPCGARR